MKHSSSTQALERCLSSPHTAAALVEGIKGPAVAAAGTSVSGAAAAVLALRAVKKVWATAPAVASAQRLRSMASPLLALALLKG